jgi:nucleoside-diphosphate-sugar epimerase
MINIVHDASPEIVFHLASLFIANHREEDINALIYSNLLFGTQLSEAMVKTGALCLVNTGTSWQHFENEKYNPVNLYAATKQAFEDILKYYIESKKLKVVSLHLFDTFGDDDPRAKLMNLLNKTMETQIPLDMSPGEQKIDLVHVDDVVTAFIMAGSRCLEKKDNEHEIYGVATGEPVSLKTLVSKLEEKYGKKIPVNWGTRQYREREVMAPWTNYKILPGWSCKNSL